MYIQSSDAHAKIHMYIYVFDVQTRFSTYEMYIQIHMLVYYTYAYINHTCEIYGYN